MKTKMFLVIGAIMVVACQKSEVISDFTGNEAVYALVPGSELNVSGQVTFKERKDGSTTVLVELTGTNGTKKFPLHLHLGDISKADAEVAALLSPVDASTGMSETIVSALADETTLSYARLLELSACIKVHLDNDGPGRNVILAAGNIGSNGVLIPGGRLTIGVCSSK